MLKEQNIKILKGEFLDVKKNDWNVEYKFIDLDKLNSLGTHGLKTLIEELNELAELKSEVTEYCLVVDEHFTVKEVSENSKVKLKNKTGKTVIYHNLTEVWVSVGDEIKKGESIGIYKGKLELSSFE